MTARILIVDDRAVVRAELRSVLELFGGVIVVGEAASGEEALRQAQALQPDLVLMDLEMQSMDGVEATRQIKARHLAPAVLVLTVYGDAYHQKRALEAGADAFVIKGAELGIIIGLIEKLTEGAKDG